VFTPEGRGRLREGLVSAAYADARITGAAVTGSAAVGREDQWSDVDLALCIAADADLGQVLADWTDRMYQEHAAVHHVDVTRGATLYRVSCSLAPCKSTSPSGQRRSSVPSPLPSGSCSGTPMNDQRH